MAMVLLPNSSDCMDLQCRWSADHIGQSRPAERCVWYPSNDGMLWSLPHHPDGCLKKKKVVNSEAYGINEVKKLLAVHLVHLVRHLRKALLPRNGLSNSGKMVPTISPFSISYNGPNCCHGTYAIATTNSGLISRFDSFGQTGFILFCALQFLIDSVAFLILSQYFMF